jgi:hypothetical protein
MSSIVVSVDPLRSLAFGSIGATYLPLGTAFEHPVRILKIMNTSNTDMVISFDGINDHDYIPAGGFSLYDLTTNMNETAGWFFRIGTQIYVKYATAPASGSVFAVALYGKGE